MVAYRALIGQRPRCQKQQSVSAVAVRRTGSVAICFTGQNRPQEPCARSAPYWNNDSPIYSPGFTTTGRPRQAADKSDFRADDPPCHRHAALHGVRTVRRCLSPAPAVARAAGLGEVLDPARPRSLHRLRGVRGGLPLQCDSDVRGSGRLAIVRCPTTDRDDDPHGTQRCRAGRHRVRLFRASGRAESDRP